MKISIIVPIYNVEHELRDCLISVFNQTYVNIEYIFVDDCGIDQSMGVLKKTLKEFEIENSKYKIIHHTHNRGLSAARNSGMKEATGEYIFFLDSDDQLFPDSIHYLLEEIINSNADFVIGNIELCNARSIHIPKPINGVFRGETILSLLLERKIPAAACNKLYRKTFLLENNITFDEGYIHEDIAWSFRVCKYAKTVSLIPRNTYKYIIKANSITTSSVSEFKVNSILFALKSIISEFDALNLSTHLRKQFFNYIGFVKLNTLLLILNIKGSYFVKKAIYNKVQAIKTPHSFIYSTTNRLPHLFFVIIFFVPYRLYKKSLQYWPK